MYLLVSTNSQSICSIGRNPHSADFQEWFLPKAAFSLSESFVWSWRNVTFTCSGEEQLNSIINCTEIGPFRTAVIRLSCQGEENIYLYKLDKFAFRHLDMNHLAASVALPGFVPNVLGWEALDLPLWLWETAALISWQTLTFTCTLSATDNVRYALLRRTFFGV